MLLVIHKNNDGWPISMRRGTHGDAGSRCDVTCDDCETFRIPPSLFKRTIRMPDEGEWRCRARLAFAALLLFSS